ncbi:ATP-dependent Clp protease ATP-binding subunit [Tasmannia lanceolata]|uniref:ATP-dependent Clp protease ATP-binding subunit n=1 Tax=Tasmannia lanceolata TaxID=3420 RepID=UPI004064A823
MVHFENPNITSMVSTIGHQMGCKMNSPPNSPLLFKFSNKRLAHLSPFPLQSNHKRHTIISSSSQNQTPQEPITTTIQTQLPKTGLCSVKFLTMRDCKLGISRYPDFNYNAEGGKGTATGRKNADNILSKISVSFDLQTLYIPSLTSVTTRFLGLPLPPFLKIDIVPELFKGTIDEETGQVDLEFRAKFWFSGGSIYRAPPLVVETLLTSEESRGEIKKGKGERLDGEGKCRLVGVATIEPIDDIFMNSFLGLPTECLADMNAKISITASG